jgi:8-oxo-dGTP diphosphatase
MYIVNVEGIVWHQGRYLMITRGAEETQDPLALSMPGGKVEVQGNLQDVLEETIRREIQEETGIEIGAEFHYLESKSFVMNSGSLVVDIVFLCSYKSGELRISDPHEVEDIQWMTAEEIFEHPGAAQWTCQSIRKAETFINGK